MKCLVTGSAGFIGSHLFERLLSLGHEVHGLDNYQVGRFRHENIKEWNVVSSAVPHMEYDWVFHLAALADIVPSIERPKDYYNANVSGTIRMLEWARRCPRLKRFVYAASSSCYGIPHEYPTAESAPIKPMYPYALTKAMGEELVLHYHQVYKLPTISLRFFNVYGPRARTSGTYGAVFGVFLSQLANNLPLTIVGDGSQTRDFTYISDVVDALILAAESKESGPFNIGSDSTTTINRIATLLGGTHERVYLPKRPGEPDCTFADISKAYQKLKYYPKVTIEEGCMKMSELIADFKDAPQWTAAKIHEATKAWFGALS